MTLCTYPENDRKIRLHVEVLVRLDWLFQNSSDNILLRCNLPDIFKQKPIDFKNKILTLEQNFYHSFTKQPCETWQPFQKY